MFSQRGRARGYRNNWHGYSSPDRKRATDFFERRLQRDAASAELMTIMEVLTSEILQLKDYGSRLKDYGSSQ